MQQQYQCSSCGARVAFGMRFCSSCGVQLNWPTQQQAPYPSHYQQQIQSPPFYQQQQPEALSQQGMFVQNTSGQGKSALILSEIKEWNWGAFTFAWIWGICNGVWVSLLCLIPFVAWVIVFVLGAKGNEWAWQSKRWDSIEHFRRTQRAWRNWAIVVLVLNLILGVMIAIAESATYTSVSPGTI